MKSTSLKALQSNITKEVYRQIGENFPKLIPFIIKVDVEEISENMISGYGTSTLLIGGTQMNMPFTYRNGQVDAISYIAQDDNDSVFTLTQKLYKKIISAAEASIGLVQSKDKAEKAIYDSSIIGNLFATPRTFTPKFASEGYLGSVLENDSLRGSFKQNMGNVDFKIAIASVYGEDVEIAIKHLDMKRKLRG